jgi:hypothetical protein
MWNLFTCEISLVIWIFCIRAPRGRVAVCFAHEHIFRVIGKGLESWQKERVSQQNGISLRIAKSHDYWKLAMTLQKTLAEVHISGKPIQRHVLIIFSHIHCDSVIRFETIGGKCGLRIDCGYRFFFSIFFPNWNYCVFNWLKIIIQAFIDTYKAKFAF